MEVILLVIQVTLLLLLTNLSFSESFNNQCYGVDNKPRKCTPEFVNAAFNLKVKATNTCGITPIEYCKQVSLHSANEFRSTVCDFCDNNDPYKSHPSEYLTDYSSNPTWWQSETMLEGIQYPNSVNLTINLGKSFEITYIQIKFHSPRPESFAIYKKINETSEWTPYQYYSASCESTYGVASRFSQINRGNEAIALCTDEFSDIAPLTGASVAFSTLEGRPSAYSFDTSEELKDWVTATDIKIVLNRLNTFGDEIFNKTQVLKSYYYAISDIAIGGRCKCNGHADKCIMKQGENFEETLRCDCKHNTDGTDCERCLPFYNDVPWAPATFTNAHECKPCNCNGKSEKCFFDRDLFENTGHGSHCVECEDNTAGVNCEHCKEGFYRLGDDDTCIDCQCHPFGSESLQCDPEGKCRCKPGVTGLKCDLCLDNFYDLDIMGCKPCNCSSSGSFDNPVRCDPIDGKCRCKANVEGSKCDRCKPGFYNMETENSLGCIQCFCFGHSSECVTSTNYYETQLLSNFELDNEEWNIIDSANQINLLNYDKSLQAIFISNGKNELWFDAPSKFLGNLRNSYNQDIKIELKINRDDIKITRKDIILENSNIGLSVYRPLIKDSNELIENKEGFQEIIIKLKETDHWSPFLSVYEFHRLLLNITAIRLKASLSRFNTTYLKSFMINTAKAVDDYMINFREAKWVEKCNCPPGYTGQFCESCDEGYHREIVNGDVFTRCVPCSCNNHSKTCEQRSGKCDCTHYTTGDNCEKCKEGYYGNPLNGNENDCKKCQCPNDGPCAEFYNYHQNSVDLVCLNCPEGTQGNLCEICEDGYFLNTVTGTCDKCICNGNIDDNAIGNCNSLDGRCLKCIYNTTGDQCEKCLPGYWGDALSEDKCFACECNRFGTYSNQTEDYIQCNAVNGQCECKSHVIGQRCDQCQENYWNILSGDGCEECKCDPLGSLNLTCNLQTGQCYCKPGVIGLKCEKCSANYYQFSDEGCKPCNCDPFGSISTQCNDFGKCICKENIIGQKCNKCAENHYNIAFGCLKCEDCYNLVEKKTKTLREKLDNVRTYLKDTPEKFESIIRKLGINERLEVLQNSLSNLHKNYFGANISNYNDYIKYLSNEVKIITDDIKTRDVHYESKKNQLELLDNLQSLVGNAELELSAVQLIIEDLETQVKRTESEKKNPENIKTNELSKTIRRITDEREERVGKVELAVNNEINNIQYSFEKLNQYQNDLAHKSKNKAHKIIDVESLVDQSKETKNLAQKDIEYFIESLRKLSENKFEFNSHGAEINKMENSIETLNKIGAALRSEIESLTNKINAFNTKEVTNATKFAEASWEVAKIKGKEYVNLDDLVRKYKETANNSVAFLSEVFQNTTKVFETLKNFDNLVSENQKKAEKAKSNEKETIQNNEKINELHKKLLSDIQQMYAEITHIKSETNLSLNQIDGELSKLKILKQNSDKLATNSNNLTSSTEFVNDIFKNMKSKIAELMSLNINYPKTYDSYQKYAEELLNDSKNIHDKINNTTITANNLKDSKIIPFQITKDELKILDEKMDIFNILFLKTSNFDEIFTNLDIMNKKLSLKIENLKNDIPGIEKEIDNLSKINDSINSNECYLGKSIAQEIEETSYER